MFGFMFRKSEESLRIFARAQAIVSVIVALVVFAAIFNGLSDLSVVAAAILGIAVAFIVWFLMMFSAWSLYSFADLVEYTKETNREFKAMSSGLAEYTKATNQVMSSMSKDLFFVARHYYAEEEKTEGKTVVEEATEKKNDSEEI